MFENLIYTFKPFSVKKNPNLRHNLKCLYAKTPSYLKAAYEDPFWRKFKFSFKNYPNKIKESKIKGTWTHN